MNRLLAIPTYTYSCKAALDKGRGWSVVDEILLWAVHERPQTMDELAHAADLPRALVVASLARMMRFQLVEVEIVQSAARFGATDVGAAFVGRSLPVFPKRITRRVNFCIERLTGAMFRRGAVRLVTSQTLDRARDGGADVRVLNVTDGAPPTTPEAMNQRVAELAVRGYDESFARICDLAASARSDEFLVVDVIDGVLVGLPKSAPEGFRLLMEQVARDTARGNLSIPYSGPKIASSQAPVTVRAALRFNDVIVGGDAHKATFLELLARAERHVVVHSTFLAFERFDRLRAEFRKACARGVTIDILYGADEEDDPPNRNSVGAAEIMAAVRSDLDLVGRVRVRMRSTGSHAKILLSDGPGGRWVGVVGSCNWLLSPFRSVELSAVLRAPKAVALLARALGRLAGHRGTGFDELASSLIILADQLDAERDPESVGDGSITLLAGRAHEQIARVASGAAKRRLVFGSHRLGATARPGVLLQSIAAAAREDVGATVLYTRASGPLKAADARRLEAEMQNLRVHLLPASGTGTGMHGKFLVWDSDDIVVSSLNWASAQTDDGFPEAELGVHFHASGLGTDVLTRIAAALPEFAHRLR